MAARSYGSVCVSDLDVHQRGRESHSPRKTRDHPLTTFGEQRRALPGPLVLDELADDRGLEDALAVHVEARHGPVRVDGLCKWCDGYDDALLALFSR